MPDRKILHRQSVAIEQIVFATALPRVLHQLRQISRDGVGSGYVFMPCST